MIASMRRKEKDCPFAPLAENLNDNYSGMGASDGYRAAISNLIQ